MGDIDSSLIYFCEKIAPSHRIAFTGECADELFCGYPWYHRSEMYGSGTFPWSIDLAPRKLLLTDSFAEKLNMEEYVQTQYHNACGELLPEGETSPELLHRQTMYLTMRYFMQTLVDRTDRAASLNSMDIRVPFADFALAEYLFSVPYEMKTKDGEVKHLLREFAKGLLPEDVRTRQKSPYPKTYDPGYEALLAKALLAVVSDPGSPILAFADPKKIAAFCQNPKDYGSPWYGQLMAGPQLMAYYLQINYWLEHYHVEIDLN
jgi:asparagine synthase (glutamine-hydrolysing)